MFVDDSDLEVVEEIDIGYGFPETQEIEGRILENAFSGTAIVVYLLALEMRSWYWAIHQLVEKIDHCNTGNYFWLY